jgi:Protein of unknown function (DUF1571)
MQQLTRQVPARRLHLTSIVLFGVAVLSLALALPPSADGQNAPAPPGGQPTPPVQQVTVADNPLEQPLAMMYEARKVFAAVKDYTCTLQSQERVGGKLQEANVMQCKMRTQPFSVYMRWLAPKDHQAQEVCFVLGKNNNKMRVHAPKHFGGKIAGFVSVDPTDPRVTEHSRHNIYEAGIGNLIEQTIKYWEFEKQVGKTQVKMAAFTYNNRPCTRIETTRTEHVQGVYCYRSVLYVDSETKLPVRTENYDWPRAGGPADGELIEVFSYFDVRLNAGLTEQDFNK